jgi:hypothetical protein
MQTGYAALCPQCFGMDRICVHLSRCLHMTAMGVPASGPWAGHGLALPAASRIDDSWPTAVGASSG